MRLLIVNYFCIKEVLFRNKKIRQQLTGVILSKKCVRLSDAALGDFFFFFFIVLLKALKICYEHRACSNQRCSF